MLLTPHLDDSSSEPLYMQIYSYIKQEIIAGRIPPSAKLPSIRELSDQLGVSRNPVEAAYQQLVMEGYAVSRSKSGIFAVEAEPGLESDEPPLVPVYSPQDKSDFAIDFGFDRMALDHFPYSTWRKLALSVLQPAYKELYLYGDPQGESGLRKEIASYLRSSRGILCSPDQIIVTSGTQQSLLLISQMMKCEHNAIAVEEAIHSGVRMILSHQGFELLPIPLDEDGLSVHHLSHSKAAAVYVTPSHQFPYGMIMPSYRRRKLLDWSRDTGGLIIEDDYDSEFRFAGKPLHSLFGLSPHGNVVYIGTFSKALAPALRLGFMVLPPKLLERYYTGFQEYDQTASRLQQKTMQLFMEEGYFDRHIRKMKLQYRKKQTFLLKEVSSLGDHVAIRGTCSGLHIVLEVKSGATEAELTKLAEQAGVRVYPVSIYHIAGEPAVPSVLLGFGGLEHDEIFRGIKLLKEAWKV
ncbi:PLP-dependent aminotransferase family protein [Paenibacillus tarimensis]